MEKQGWKTLTIILIVLIILETIGIIYIIYLGTREINNENECLFDICGVYPQAHYDSGVCSCYDYDVLGELVLKKTEYMK